MPQMERLPLTFENGLLESMPESTLPNGFAADLVNWIPQPTGGVKSRTGWKKSSPEGAPTTRSGRGIGQLALQDAVATPVLRQTVGNADAFATQIYAAFSSATIAGNTLIATLFFKEDVDSPNISVSAPTGWVLAASASVAPASGAKDWRAYIYYYANAPAHSASTNIIFTSSPSFAEGLLTLIEYSGLAIAPLDRTATASGTSTAASTGVTAATTQAQELWFALFGYDPSASTSVTAGAPSNGFQTIHATAPFATSNAATVVAHKTVTATGTATSGISLNPSTEWVGLIATFKAETIPQTGRRYVVAHDDSTQYKLYQVDADAVASGAWSFIENVSVSNTPLLVAFTSGLGNLFYSTRQFATLRRWDGTATASVAAGPAARALAFHHNRVFAGGTSAAPSRLHFSDFGNYATWGANSYIDVAKDDGEAIEDIAIVQDALLIGKKSSLYLLSGVGPQTFELHPVQSGGCAPGSAICPTPFGTVVAGNYSVYMLDGLVADESFSEGIENSYCIEGDFVTTAYVNRRVYICDEGTGKIWAYDFRKQTWWTEEIASNVDAPAVIAADENRLLYSPKAGTTQRLLGFRSLPLCLEEHVKDESLAMQFTLKTPEYWIGGPSSPITPFSLYLVLRQRGGDAGGTPLEVTPIYNGERFDPIRVFLRDEPGTYREIVNVANSTITPYSVQYEFSRTTTTTETGLLDIEGVELHFQREDAR